MTSVQSLADRSLRSSSADRSIGFPDAAGGLLGRAREVSEVTEALGACRLVTLTGAPGIGKTRLALAVGKACRDRSVVVELAVVSEPRAATAALTSALRLRELPGQSLTETLLAHLRRQRVLLILDNCEHLIGSCARLVEELLSGCPKLRVLATSREALSLSEERIWQVPPLSVPQPSEAAAADPETLLQSYAAVRLFVNRAMAVEPRFAFNAYVAPWVAQICRHLDGIPLAIEIAAAHASILNPQEIAARLDDRVDLLTANREGGPFSQHQSLEAALDWSFDLLSGAERALLRRLSVFVGGFCPDAAQAVCAIEDQTPEELLEGLTGLAAKSLVVSDASGPGAVRYRLLQSVLAYGAARLDDSEVTALRDSHAFFYRELAERAEGELIGPLQDRWLDRLDAERANVRRALEWSLAHGQSEQALGLAGSLVLFWRMRCHFSEGLELLDAALSASSDRPPEPWAKALWGAGFMASMTGDGERAIPLLEDSLTRFRELGDRTGQGRALLLLGNWGLYRGELHTLSLLEESAALAEQVGDAWCRAHALGLLGVERLHRDELAASRLLLEQCLEVGRHAGERHSQCLGLTGLGGTACSQGDYEFAEPVLEEAIALARELGDHHGRGAALQYLGQIALVRADYERAREVLDEAVDLLREIGGGGALVLPLLLRAVVARADRDLPGARRCLEEASALAPAGTCNRSSISQALGELACAEGRLAPAGRLFEEALELARQRSDGSAEARALYCLGDLAAADEDLPRSALMHKQALERRKDVGDAQGLVISLEAVAGLAATAGRHERAGQLLGAAQAQREAKGLGHSPWGRSRVQAALAVVRQGLSQADFEAAINQGAGLSLEQAAALACDGRGRHGRDSNGWSSLTDSEQRVVTLAAEGLTNAEIADRLYLSHWTVKGHLARVYGKLGVAGRTELAREAARRAKRP